MAASGWRSKIFCTSLNAPVCTQFETGSEPNVIRPPRNRLEAPDRKLALILAVVRARRAAEDVFNDRSVALTDRKPLPTASQVVKRVRDDGIRDAAFMDLQQYIKRCPDEDRCPEPEGILNSPIPRACKNGLIRGALRRDPPPRATRRYQLAKPSESEIYISEAEFPLELA